MASNSVLHVWLRGRRIAVLDAVWVAAHSLTPPDCVDQLIPRLEAHWGSRGWR